MAISTYTALDIVNIAGFRTGVFKQKLDTLANADVATDNMIEVMNTVLRAVARVKGLPSLNAQTEIALTAPYSTGTASLNNASATVTGSGTTFDASMVGRAFALTTGSGSVYRIATYTNATTIVLDKVWAEANVVTQPYTIAQDRYSLPTDFNEFVSANFEGPDARALEFWSPSQMDFQRYQNRTRPLTVGTPSYASLYPISGTAPTDLWQIVLDPFPDALGRVAVKYRKAPTKIARTDSATYMPVGDDRIDVVINGMVALWQKIAGADGGAVAYQAWEQNELPTFSAFDQHKTDERLLIQPGNYSRETQPSRLV